MPKFAANLSLMFNEHDFLDRFSAAAAQGFEAVEFLFPYAFDPAQICKELRSNDLQLVLFNLYPGDWQGGERGLAALKGRETDFQNAMRQAIEFARALECKQLHAMAGLITDGADRDTYVANLKTACAWAAPHGITILIEPINTIDMPGYFLSKTQQAAAIIEEVAHDNIGLQFDLYHRHKMEGGVAGAIETYRGLTRHYQCAAPRDRGEPDRQDLDYQEIFQTIDKTGFAGWIGCEYRPRAATIAGLAWRQELVAG